MCRSSLGLSIHHLLRGNSILFKYASERSLLFYYCMPKATRRKAKSAQAAPRRKKVWVNALSMAQFLTTAFNLQKSSGIGPTLLLGPDPGPSSTTIETEHSAQFQPAQPPVAAPVPATSSSLPTWPTAGHAPHTAPSFTTVNPLQTYPTFAATIVTQAQHTGNLELNVTSTTSPVPSARHVTWSAEPFQSPANAVPGSSPRPSESPRSGSEADNTPSRGPPSKRIRVSRRNPIYGFVEGAMVGNKERGETFSCSLFYDRLIKFLLAAVPRKKELRDLQSNALQAGRRFRQEVEELVCRVSRI